MKDTWLKDSNTRASRTKNIGKVTDNKRPNKKPDEKALTDSNK